MSASRLRQIKNLTGSRRVYLRSILIFAGLIILWLVFYPWLMDTSALSRLMDLVAGLTAFILYLLGNPVIQQGNIVNSPAFSMEIGNECTGIVPMLLLVCGAAAFPSSITKKIICIALGIPVLFLLNLTRTVSLYYTGVHFPAYFEIAHFVVWQSLTILAVIGIWLLWIRKVVNVPPP